MLADYQYEAFSQLPGVENPEDSGAGKSGVYWHPTYSVSFALKLIPLKSMGQLTAEIC